MKKVLIVDDSDMTISIISEFIRDELGRLFEIATSSQEAKRLIEQEDFEIVICDYEMPNGNGNEVLEYLVDNQKKIDFVYFSGKYDLDERISSPLIRVFNDKNYEKLFNFLSDRYLKRAE